MRLQRLTGLEQDKIVGEYSEVMATIADLLDILAKPERVTAIIGDELAAHQAGVRPEPRTSARRTRSSTTRIDLDTEDLIAPKDMVVTLSHTRLHQEPAACRIPRAAARRPRQAGDGDQGRRLHRPAVHRQHARLHPVLLQPRPRLLAQGLRSAAGLARLARQADRQHVPAGRGREDHRGAAGQGSSTRRPVRVHGDRAWARSRRRRCPTSRNPRKAGIIAVDLDDGDYLIGAALTDGKHDVMLFSDGGKAVRFDENDVRPMGRNARGVRGMMLDEGQSVIAHAGRRGRDAERADRDRERLRQAHADRRVHAPRPRHQGHDRDPDTASATARWSPPRWCAPTTRSC